MAPLVSAESCPGKQVQAQVNRRGIQSINRLVQLQSHRLVLVKGASTADEQLRQIEVNAPVAFPVGVGQGAVGNFAANTQMVKVAVTRAQAGFHITETLPVSELAKGRTKKLTPTRESLYFVVAVVTSDTAVKLFWVDEIGKLSDDEFSGVHPGSVAPNLLGENRPNFSNRSHPLTSISAR